MKKLSKLHLIALAASLVMLSGCQSVLGAEYVWDAGTDPSYFQAEGGIFQYPDIPWGSSTAEMKLPSGKTQKLDLNELYRELENSFTEAYGEPTDKASIEKPPFHVTAWRTFLTQENGRYLSNSIALRFLGTEENPSKVSIEISNTLMAPEFSPEQLKKTD